MSLDYAKRQKYTFKLQYHFGGVSEPDGEALCVPAASVAVKVLDGLHLQGRHVVATVRILDRIDF